MKVVAVVGSPRKGGNTEIMAAHALKAIAEEGLETELVRLGELSIVPCNACRACAKLEQCTIKDDLFPLYQKMKAADGIILASPVFFGAATSMMRAAMERAGYIAQRHRTFAGKVGGPIVVARRAGHNFTIAELTLWYQVLGMVVPGSTYWNVGFGRELGDVARDEEGMRTVWQFGKNIAWVAKKLAAP